MRGRFAADAEVAWRADQSRAEMPLPHAVDEHARRERIRGIDDCLGEVGAAVTGRERAGRVAREHFQKAAVGRLAGEVRIAAHEHALRVAAAGIAQAHRARRDARRLKIQPHKLALLVAQFVEVLLREVIHDLLRRDAQRRVVGHDDQPEGDLPGIGKRLGLAADDQLPIAFGDLGQRRGRRGEGARDRRIA